MFSNIVEPLLKGEFKITELGWGSKFQSKFRRRLHVFITDVRMDADPRVSWIGSQREYRYR